mmetsp:Transcript_6461/g.24377  ORF Transcript_6461/g.24377 Transcript_6461/m.24377 type:complete len:244 (-) Transcript_6461:1123-1854(-)
MAPQSRRLRGARACSRPGRRADEHGAVAVVSPGSEEAPHAPVRRGRGRAAVGAARRRARGGGGFDRRRRPRLGAPRGVAGVGRSGGSNRRGGRYKPGRFGRGAVRQVRQHTPRVTNRHRLGRGFELAEEFAVGFDVTRAVPVQRQGPGPGVAKRAGPRNERRRPVASLRVLQHELNQRRARDARNRDGLEKGSRQYDDFGFTAARGGRKRRRPCGRRLPEPGAGGCAATRFERGHRDSRRRRG